LIEPRIDRAGRPRIHWRGAGRQFEGQVGKPKRKILVVYALAGFVVALAVLLMLGSGDPLDPIPTWLGLLFMGILAISIWTGGAVARAAADRQELTGADWFNFEAILKSLPLGLAVIVPLLVLEGILLEQEIGRLAAVPLLAFAFLVGQNIRKAY
jgi:hypothetical protein